VGISTFLGVSKGQEDERATLLAIGAITTEGELASALVAHKNQRATIALDLCDASPVGVAIDRHGGRHTDIGDRLHGISIIGHFIFSFGLGTKRL
jgi:hypothetical protein